MDASTFAATASCLVMPQTLQSFDSSSKYDRTTRAQSLSAPRASPGFGPYSASSSGERHTPGLPSPVTLRLQGFYPPDAFFPPKPPAMFQTVTLLGFPLRRFPLPRHGRILSDHPARLALARTDLLTRATQVLARLPGFHLRGSPLSPASRRSGRTRASLGFRPPPGLPSPDDTPL